MKPSQNNLILKALKRGAKLTPIDALARFGCFRLSARILDLKAAGHNIKTKIIKSANGKQFAQYSLPRERKGKT
jgi:hypothetical protein